MHVEYYPIKGRGEMGTKFQLARFKDENGEMYKGQYDQDRHFSSEEEVKEHIAEVIKLPVDQFTLSKMSL